MSVFLLWVLAHLQAEGRALTSKTPLASHTQDTGVSPSPGRGAQETGKGSP